MFQTVEPLAVMLSRAHQHAAWAWLNKFPPMTFEEFCAEHALNLAALARDLRDPELPDWLKEKIADQLAADTASAWEQA